MLRAPAFASRGKGRAHRVFHPLCGATLGTLTRLAVQGGVSPGRAHVMAIAFGVAAVRSPFTAAEAAWCRWARPRTGVSGAGVRDRALAERHDAPDERAEPVGRVCDAVADRGRVAGRSAGAGAGDGAADRAVLSEDAVDRRPRAGAGPAAGRRAGDGQSVDAVVQSRDLFSEPAAAGVRSGRVRGRRGPARDGGVGAAAGSVCGEDDEGRGRAAVVDPQSGQQRADPDVAADLAGRAVHPHPSAAGGGVRVVGADVRDAGAGVVAGAGRGGCGRAGAARVSEADADAARRCGAVAAGVPGGDPLRGSVPGADGGDRRGARDAGPAARAGGGRGDGAISGSGWRTVRPPIGRMRGSMPGFRRIAPRSWTASLIPGDPRGDCPLAGPGQSPGLPSLRRQEPDSWCSPRRHRRTSWRGRAR